MSVTERDKKILAVLALLAALAAYWFLLLSPKRAEVAKVDGEIAKQRQQLDAARQQMARATAARDSFATDYAQIVRLGKAIPTTVDMPSLLVQLDSAARGTDIDFDKITPGSRVPAGGSANGSTPPPAPGGAAAPGGQEAGSAPGKAAEQAGETAQQAGGEQPAPQASGTPAPVPAGLDTVPLTFAFEGSFFNLADFFHRLKRFVRVDGNRIAVRGRLMTIDSLKMSVGEDGGVKADVAATAYLAPKAEGATAGATPAGPAPQAADPQSASSGAPAPPAAIVQR